ncbi:MAG: hypothetical protein HYX51_10980 [Chloroflexi bacterium]|nr:hypothetical protein [Chloroflexota bacterium]
MGVNGLMVGLGMAVLAIGAVLLVIVPVFLFVNLIYDDGSGLTPLLIVVVATSIVLTRLLARRRITL